MCNGSGGNEVSFYIVQLPVHLVLRMEIQFQGRICMVLCPDQIPILNTTVTNFFIV